VHEGRDGLVERALLGNRHLLDLIGFMLEKVRLKPDTTYAVTVRLKPDAVTGPAKAGPHVRGCHITVSHQRTNHVRGRHCIGSVRLQPDGGDTADQEEL
jgi:hypothetical protein